MIIVGGFEPFGGRPVNRAWETVARLPERAGLERVRLPVDFSLLAELVPQLVARRPSALLLVGEGGVRAIRIERVAHNTVDAEKPDNAGRKPRDQRVVPDGPRLYLATWDTRAAAAAVAAAGLDAQISHDAGAYACNAALYLALHAAAALPIRPPIGFLHVPAAPWPFRPRTAQLARAVDAVLAVMAPAYAEYGATHTRDGG